MLSVDTKWKGSGAPVFGTDARCRIAKNRQATAGLAPCYHKTIRGLMELNESLIARWREAVSDVRNV